MRHMTTHGIGCRTSLFSAERVLFGSVSPGSVLGHERGEDGYVFQHQAYDLGRNVLQPVLEDDILCQCVRGDQQIALFREHQVGDVGIRHDAAYFLWMPEVNLPWARGGVVFRPVDGLDTALRIHDEIERAADSAERVIDDREEVLHLQQDRFVQVGDARSKGFEVRQEACQVLVPGEDPGQW